MNAVTVRFVSSKWELLVLKIVKSPQKLQPKPVRPTRTSLNFYTDLLSKLRLRISAFSAPSSVRASGRAFVAARQVRMGGLRKGRGLPGRAWPLSSGLRQLRAHPSPPSFVVRPIARVTGNPVQGAPPSWTCPRKILRDPQEQSPLPPLLPLARLHLLVQPATCRGLGRPPPPLFGCARTLLPRPDAPPPARKAAQPPATPQVTQVFRSVRPAEASSPGSAEATSGDDGDPGPRAGSAAGLALSDRSKSGGAVGAVGPCLPGLPCGGESVPARRPPKPLVLPAQRRGVWGRVCSASPSPPPRSHWADWPGRRPFSPGCRSRRLRTTPAVFIRASRALQPTGPRRGRARPVGRV